jgi:hypothetical protein
VAAAAAEGPAPLRASTATGGRRVGFRGDVVGGEEEEGVVLAAVRDDAATVVETKGRFKVSSPPKAQQE